MTFKEAIIASYALDEEARQRSIKDKDVFKKLILSTFEDAEGMAFDNGLIVRKFKIETYETDNGVVGNLILVRPETPPQTSAYVSLGTYLIKSSPHFKVDMRTPYDPYLKGFSWFVVATELDVARGKLHEFKAAVVREIKKYGKLV